MIKKIKGRDFILKFIKNSSGVSIVEALIGLAILGSFTLVSTQFSGIKKISKKQRSVGTCEQIANMYMTELQSGGSVSQIVNTHKDADPSSAITVSSPEAFSHPLVERSSLWPNNSSYYIVEAGLPPSTQPILRNALLVNGTLRALATFYNDNKDYTVGTSCTSASNSSCGVTDTTLQSLVDISNSNINLDVQSIRFRMVPVNLATGEENKVLGKPLIFKPVPASILSEKNAFTAGHIRTPPSSSGTYTDEYGMKVQIFVDYYLPDDKSNLRNCSLSRNMQLYRSPEISAPSVKIYEDDIELGTTSYDDVNDNCPAPRVGDVRVEIGYDGDLPDGVIFLCREGGTRQKEREIPCYKSGNWTMQPRKPSPNYKNINRNNPLLWKPCSELTLCGESQSVNHSWSPSSASSISDKKILNLTYANDSEQLLGCEIGIEVMAVDPSGNYAIEDLDEDERGNWIEIPRCDGVFCPYRTGYWINGSWYKGWDEMGYGCFSSSGGYYNCNTACATGQAPACPP